MRIYFSGSIAMILFATMLSCTASKNINGTYRSNFAELGFFVTQLRLNADSSFLYHMQGDVMNEYAKGFYTIKRRQLLLHYVFPPVDTSGYAFLRSMNWLDVNANKKWEDSFPKLFFIRHNKLFSSNNKGHMVKQSRPKSIFYKHKRKYYLQRIA